MSVASPATGHRRAASTLSASSWRETAANLRSRWIREPSPGTPTGRETTGIETSAIHTSGGEEDDQTGVEVGFRAPIRIVRSPPYSCPARHAPLIQTPKGSPKNLASLWPIRNLRHWLPSPFAIN